MSSDIYVATRNFVTKIDGKRYQVRRDQTRVRAGHPLLKGREGSFKPLDVHYDVEQATQAPGEKRHPMDGAFDPARYSVAEVNAYLAEAEHSERERVLQAEAEGKGRLGVVHGPHSG